MWSCKSELQDQSLYLLNDFRLNSIHKADEYEFRFGYIYI